MAKEHNKCVSVATINHSYCYNKSDFFHIKYYVRLLYFKLEYDQGKNIWGFNNLGKNCEFVKEDCGKVYKEKESRGIKNDIKL